MQQRTAREQQATEQRVHGSYVELLGETYYRIRNSHLMPEFFMSVVGADDHWMFISSHGALTAGRRNPDGAIFPYAADDQLSAMRDRTGPLTLIRSAYSNALWQPFVGGPEACQVTERSVYKSPMGNKIVFEEHEPSTGMVFRYRWTSSPRFGFVRDCWLENTGSQQRQLNILDGVQNILPCGVGSEFWMRYSNLGNAYKKNEKAAGADLGLFYLSSIPSDRAEPSEGLRSTVAWHLGLQPDTLLLTSSQVARFHCGMPLETEVSERGKAGAFLVSASLSLEPGETQHWRMVIDLGKDQTDIVNLQAWLARIPCRR
ncbi:MAG: hypothetical protein O3C45_00735 [Bacteroidetes bacterium]|nr:hypothetical protein [Bacteroidota bacterium]